MYIRKCDKETRGFAVFQYVYKRQAYDYLIPQTLWAKAEKGCRVLVPFGGGNRTRQGLLMDVEEIRAGRTGSEEGLKSVKAVLAQTPLLSPEMLLLARWMKERYFCTLFDAVRVMLPAGLHYQVACSYPVSYTHLDVYKRQAIFLT